MRGRERATILRAVHDARSALRPLAAAAACYTIWGFVPLLFQAIGRMGVDPWEILTHRTLWALPVAAVFVVLARQTRQVGYVLARPQVLRWLVLSAALIATNWVLFIYAVNTGRVLQTSLGYFITPVLNMAAGAWLLRERLDAIGKTAVALAVFGVVIQALALGYLPWISIVLAVSFCAYGVVRKQVQADAQTGLFIECALLVVPAALYWAWLQRHGLSHFGRGEPATLGLVAAGVITAIPLLMFAWAARRLPLSALGFLQFIAPSITFVLGTWQGEAFSTLRLFSFAIIWTSAIIFLWGAWRRTPRSASLSARGRDATPAGNALSRVDGAA